MKLNQAVVCMDCEEITEGRNNRCELCSSRAILVLAVVLNRTPGVPPSKERHLYAREGTA